MRNTYGITICLIPLHVVSYVLSRNHTTHCFWNPIRSLTPFFGRFKKERCLNGIFVTDGSIMNQRMFFMFNIYRRFLRSQILFCHIIIHICLPMLLPVCACVNICMCVLVCPFIALKYIYIPVTPHELYSVKQHHRLVEADKN